MEEHPDSNVASAPVSGVAARLGSYIATGLRYWERRRILYNIILSLVVLGNFVFSWPGSRGSLSVNLCLGMFVLAVLANVAYCAAYLPDIFVQLSGLNAALRWTRTVLFVVGTAFAATIAHFFSHGMFETY